MNQANIPLTYHQYTPNGWQTLPGRAVVEAPISLSVNGEFWLTFMCSPQDLEALAVGFLYNEGLIQSKADVVEVRLCAQGDHIDLWTHQPVKQPVRWRRTSGCTNGVTGISSGANRFEAAEKIEPDSPPAAPFKTNGLALDADQAGRPDQVLRLLANLFEAQDLYRESGGVHTSALATVLSDGEKLLFVAEDIGRHNTLDKLAGRLLLEEFPLWENPLLLLTTGRISSEMMQKAERMNAAVVISRRAASALAIQLAQEAGITLVGYARRDRFNVYTHPERLFIEVP